MAEELLNRRRSERVSGPLSCRRDLGVTVRKRLEKKLARGTGVLEENPPGEVPATDTEGFPQPKQADPDPASSSHGDDASSVDDSAPKKREIAS